MNSSTTNHISDSSANKANLNTDNMPSNSQLFHSGDIALLSTNEADNLTRSNPIYNNFSSNHNNNPVVRQVSNNIATTESSIGFDTEAIIDHKSLAICGMVFGIISLSLTLPTIYFGILLLPLHYVGLMFSILGLKSTNRSKAIVGIITSSIALVLAFLWLLIVFLFIKNIQLINSTQSSKYF